MPQEHADVEKALVYKFIKKETSEIKRLKFFDFQNK